jgi:hypothetical protein
MKQFGDSVLMLRADELLFRLEQARKVYPYKFSYHYDNVVYRDDLSFDHVNVYSATNSPFDYIFMKAKEPYSIQNEWRLALANPNLQIKANSGEGFSLPIGKLDLGRIFKTSALNTLRMNESALKLISD